MISDNHLILVADARRRSNRGIVLVILVTVSH